MNYDSSISSEVSLSKILDESIMDGSDNEVVFAFLKSHEKDIGEIFKHSAFAYDLYDLGMHPYHENEFLFDHITDLFGIDKCFAASLLATFLVSVCGNRGKIVELRGKFRGDVAIQTFLRSGWRGHRWDDKLLLGEIDLVESLESLVKDQRDLRSFLGSSYLARTVFQASTFLNLSPTCQYAILVAVREAVNESRGYYWMETQQVYASLVCSLLKQLLLLNHTDMFNWVEKVLDIQTSRSAFTDLVLEEFKRKIPQTLKDMMPPSGTADIWTGKEETPASFEEIVFEMNMLMSEFEPCDLFLYIYLGSSGLMKGMKENSELLEFFALPFDWNKLDNFTKEA